MIIDRAIEHAVDDKSELDRLRQMFAQSPSFSTLLVGPEHRFVLTNPAYHQLIGHRDVIGLSVREATPEVEGQGFFELLDNVFTSGQPFRGRDYKILLQRTPNGPLETRFLDFVYQPIKGADGNVTSIFVEGSDITERHATEEALRLSEARLRELNADLERKVIERAQARGLTWMLSPDLLGALNSNGYFETSNPAWKSVLGWTETEVASMSIFELLHPDDVEHTRAGFELTQVGQPAIRFINRYRCKDGSYRWISWVGIPEEGFVYCTGRDITQEREAAIALEATQEALRQSQKMDAIGQLTGGIAHDFNNMLTGIIGSLDIVRRRMAAGRGDDVPRFMEAALLSAHRAATLTNRLLTFARRQSLDSKPNDVNQLIDGVEELLSRTLGERIELKLALARGLWPAFIDANQFENALLNLAINARDAMPEGGHLTISTANLHRDDTHSTIRKNIEAGDYIAVTVTDTGLGMSAETLARAVEPFFTTKAPGVGTGLGLSVIDGFARQSGGYMGITSEVGRGTRVTLLFPRAIQEAIDTLQRSVTTPQGKGETILVVEDDATVRMILSDALKELGYQVLVAHDAKPALALLGSDQVIDLLVSDVVLPHVNGRKLAETARQLRPKLNVSFVTGYAENAALRSEFLEDGMEMLAKPFSLDDIGAKVHAMIHRDR